MLTMTHQTFSLNTAVIFLLITFLHAIRLLRGWQVTIEGAVVPIWISWIALAIAAYLAYQRFPVGEDQDEVVAKACSTAFFYKATNNRICQVSPRRRSGLFIFLLTLPSPRPTIRSIRLPEEQVPTVRKCSTPWGEGLRHSREAHP